MARSRHYAAAFGGGQSGSGDKLPISPEQEKSLLDQAQNTVLTGAGYVTDWLDTPGAMARGAISAGMKGEDPLTAAANAFYQKGDQRVSGRDLLRQAGLVGDEDNWGNFGAGLVAEVALDPLSLLTGPVKSLTTAGKLASKAGLIDNAAGSLSKSYISGADNLAPALVSKADDAVKKLGDPALSATDVTGRPLVGRRAALQHGTLENLVDAAADPARAKQRVLEALGNNADSAAQYENLKGSTLGKQFGLTLPFMQDALLPFNAPGGQHFSDAMDALMSGMRWSKAGRAYHAFTDNAVGGTFDAKEQAFNAGASAAKDAAQAEARRESTYQAAKLYQQEPDVFTEEGNRSLGRLIEKPKEGALRADEIWDSNHPAARDYMDWWKRVSDASPQEMAQVGLKGTVFNDPNVEGYLPRRTDNLIEQAAQYDKGLGREMSTLTSDQMHRSPELMVPGGRDTIAFKLSRDPVVAGAKRTAVTDQEAADHIMTTVFNGSPDAKSQSMELARLLHKLPSNITEKNVAPLYGQHPTSTISGYIEGRAGAKATANAVYDSLATSATNAPAELAEGGRHIKLSDALKRLNLDTTADVSGEIGARQQMRERLASRFGIDPDQLELSQISVPEDTVIRLTRAKEGFEKPEVAQQLTGIMDEFTRHWAAGILAWPSRIVRDLYSGMYSNWLAGALDPQAIPFVKHFYKLLGGDQYVTARSLLQKGAFDPQFVQFLKTMPAYKNIPDQDIAAHFYADLNAGKLLGSNAYTDQGLSTIEGSIKNQLPGIESETFGRALGELGGDYRNFLDISKNPIARANSAAGELSDRITRLTGYISLLRQGVSPEEAARRMKRAHVDYSSLTTAEKELRRRFMPFYAYTSRMFQETLRQLAERPGGRMGQGMRILEELQEPAEGEYVPESVRRGFGAAIPEDSMFGIPAELGTRYLSGVSLPGYSDLQAVDPSSIGGTFTNIAKMSNPYLRAGYEMLTSTDIANRQPINESSRSYGPLGKGIRAATGDPSLGTGRIVTGLDKVLDIIPYVARPARFAAQLYDQDAGLSAPTRMTAAAFNALAGVHFRDMPKEQIAGDKMRGLQRIASPYTRNVEVPYIPADQRDRVPLAAQEALELSRRMQREQRERRQQMR